MAMGYAGFVAPSDDGFDLTPYINRLEASPSWTALWREERGHKASTDAAREDLENVTRRARNAEQACHELCAAYEHDDAAVNHLQRVARGLVPA